jgi:hypothetical protein
MKKPAIKIIKRAANPVLENAVSPVEETTSRRHVERGLQNAVNTWIEERRKNTEIESGIAHARLRDLMA